MKEFDPRCECHYPLFIVKAVEPGCTTEFQVENALTGEVKRITTTEDAAEDFLAFRNMVLAVAIEVWDKYSSQGRAVGTVATGGES